MSAVETAEAVGRSGGGGRGWLGRWARLAWIEVRRNGMVWMLPLVAAFFWLETFHRTMTFASPPLWSLRTYYVQEGGIVGDCVPFAVGVAAWTASRDGRRRTGELVGVTARPGWTRQLTGWAAVTGWALLAYGGCVAVLYGMTAARATWGGPLWWPVVVGAVGLAACCAVGFAVGALLPGRFTAPLTAIAVYLVLVLSRGLVVDTSTFAQVLPTKTGFAIPLEAGEFYPALPDVSYVQLMFLGGVALVFLGVLGIPRAAGGRLLRGAAVVVTALGFVAADVGIGLAGTAQAGPHGVVIPLLHDAADDRPVAYTPVCGSGVVRVCLHPAYGDYLGAVEQAVNPVFGQVVGLPGAPVRIDQTGTDQSPDRQDVQPGGPFRPAGPSGDAAVPTMLMALDGSLPGSFGNDAADFTRWLRNWAAQAVLPEVVGAPALGTGSDAQQAVMAALSDCAGVPLPPPGGSESSDLPSGPAPGTPVAQAAARFAALTPGARHAWLVDHLAALRAGQVTLAEVP